MNPHDYICAARVPQRLRPQTFGPWRIKRIYGRDLGNHFGAMMNFSMRVGFESYTLLLRHSWATLHLEDFSDVVMEDSTSELRKHLPIWLAARGSVLITGLGLGCVVRGLLANERVDKITVVEIDRNILRVVGHEFRNNPRVRLIHADALQVQLRERFDFAWHDLWTDGDEYLQCLHAQLFMKFHETVGAQGAWAYPRCFKRLVRRKLNLIG